MASYERYKEYASLTAAELAAVNNIFPEGQLVVEQSFLPPFELQFSFVVLWLF